MFSNETRKHTGIGPKMVAGHVGVACVVLGTYCFKCCMTGTLKMKS